MHMKVLQEMVEETLFYKSMMEGHGASEKHCLSSTQLVNMKFMLKVELL